MKGFTIVPERPYSLALTAERYTRFPEVVDRFDHRYVNDLIENPTAEVMAEWIWRRLVEPLGGLSEVELWETASCAVVYRGE